MTKKDFLELLNEFLKKTLDPKFEKIDNQFAEANSQFKKIDGRFEKIESQLVEFREDIIHQCHVISEDVISKVSCWGRS